VAINDFPKRLKEARQRTGLNMSEMARSLGVTRAAVSKWEKADTADISAVNIAKAAMLLGCSTDELILGKKTGGALRVDLLMKAMAVVDEAFKQLPVDEKARAVAKAYGMLVRGHEVDADFITDDVIQSRATGLTD